MRRKIALIAAVAILVSALVCEAEDSERRRVLVRFEGGAESAESLAISLEAALARSSRIGSVRRASGEAAASEEAAMSGLDLAVDAKAEIHDGPEGRSLSVAWSIYAPAVAEPLEAGATEGAYPQERELPEFWIDLVRAAERAAEAVGGFGRARLVIAGPEGASIIGLGKERCTIPPEGEIAVWLPAPATYRWRAVLPSSMPETGVLALTGAGAKLEIAFRPLSGWRIEAGLLNATFPDLWASWRFADDRFYLRAGFYQFLAGLALKDEEIGYRPDFWTSDPLVQPGIGGGTLLGGAESRVRSYVGATATIRIAFPSGYGIFLDPVAPFSIGPHYGLEWRPLERWSFFMEVLANLYLFGDGRLMAASRESGGGLFLYGSSWYLEFPLARFGARFSL